MQTEIAENGLDSCSTFRGCLVMCVTYVYIKLIFNYQYNSVHDGIGDER